MKSIHLVFVLSVALFAIVACNPTPMPTATSVLPATAVAKPPLTPQPPRAQSAVSSALPPVSPTGLLRPASQPTPTPTFLPRLNGSVTPTTASSSYIFHMNFTVDQSLACTNKCDSVYIPKMTLYFRGKLGVTGNRASGDGTITIENIEPCKTLMPDLSTCQFSAGTPGSFNVAGNMQGDKIQMTLQLKDVPRLNGGMTTLHPVQGQVPIAFDSTYYEEIKQTLIKAAIFDTPFQISPQIATPGLSSQALARISHTFEGTYVFATNDKLLTRTTHGFGTLFFIQP